MHTEMSDENSSQSVITRLQIGGVHLTEEKKGEYNWGYEIMEDVNAAMTLLEKLPGKIQALNGIRTHDLCIAGAMLYQWAIKATWERSCLDLAL